MRLLDAKTLELHSFHEGHAPYYAILSHTWHDDEVLFEDLQDLSQASRKAGFAKIRFCCDQALKDGLEFVWVDTCCIDKTSSTELSEAINSMYWWYTNARVCYAYLRDISVPENGITNLKITGSRWFKRAWTLQELLAPESLVFYTDDWTRIGFSTELKKDISEITGIDEFHLDYGQTHMASISKRMSWAANREATRAEDIAYSLFGLFNVQMPLLYGEGLQKAFRRLQEEIMKYSDDHTLFAWGLPGVGPRDLNLGNRRVEQSIIVLGATHSRGILADSPADFLESRNLVPFRSRSASAKPYSMTNIGLRITLPLNSNLQTPSKLSSMLSSWGTLGHLVSKKILRSREAPKVLLAALNCHEDGNYFNVLAMPLLNVAPGQFVRHPTEDLALIPVPGADLVAGFNEQEIFIRNEELTSFSWENRHLALILPRSTPGLEVLEVWPRSFWKPKDRILQGSRYWGDIDSWQACLLLSLGGPYRGPSMPLIRKLILVLGVHHQRSTDLGAKDNKDVLDCPVNLQRRTGSSPVPQEGFAVPWCNLLIYAPDKDLDEVHHDLEVLPCCKYFNKCAFQFASVTIAPREYNATGNFADILGDFMCVVDIKINRGRISKRGY